MFWFAVLVVEFQICGRRGFSEQAHELLSAVRGHGVMGRLWSTSRSTPAGAGQWLESAKACKSCSCSEGPFCG
jgi:hypothetical protein